MRKCLAIKMFFDVLNIHRNDVCPEIISTETYYRLLRGENVTDGTLSKLAKNLGVDYLHLLHALDRLAVISKRPLINPDNFKFPEKIPFEIQEALKLKHPVFKTKNSEKVA